LFKALLKRFELERKRYQELKKNEGQVREILRNGSEKARKQAEKKMMIVREKVGITNKYSFFEY